MMIKRLYPYIILLTTYILGLCSTGCYVWADDKPIEYQDPYGDAILRRTDAGNNGPVNPNSNLPDLLRVFLGTWYTDTPVTDPYNGNWVDHGHANLLRIDVVFYGLVNPPGPIDLLGDGFDPYAYGENPLYGYIEFNVDDEIDTGGEVDNVADRPLGNAARFGGLLSGQAGQRSAVTAADIDGSLCTEPYVERSGEEFHMSFCACQSITINPLGDLTPETFDEGDKWIITGRLFKRTHAFIPYSFAYNGSEPGQYDPVVDLLFDSDPILGITTVSLVYPLNNYGAAEMSGEAPEPMDFNVANQNSILEALNETIIAAQYGSGGFCTPYSLLEPWADYDESDLDDFVDPTEWQVLALVGTAYSQFQDDANYVWTDIGPGFTFGDVTGDNLVNQNDQNKIMTIIAQTDGHSMDFDGLTNGQITLSGIGNEFALYDLNYDGKINSLDLEMIGYKKRGDVNVNREVNTLDRQMLGTLLGYNINDPQYNPAADLNHDNVIDQKDSKILLGILNLQSIDPYK